MKSTKTDLISVVIPAYNAELYLQECLDSIYAQEIPIKVEIIVVNDGSTDSTGDILKAQGDKIKVIHQANSGCVRARNAGFRLASGNFITCLDHDDLYLPLKLFTQWGYLKNHSEVDMVFCKIKQFISPELNDGSRRIPENMEVLTAMNFSGGMYRSSVFAANGYIDESLLNYGEFVDWFAKAKEKSIEHSVIAEILLLRRVHNTNLGKTRTSEQIAYLKILREKLNRANNAAK